MTVTVANCYLTNGTPATAASAQEIIYPPVQEGVQQPTPAQAASNVATAIAALSPQPGVL